MTGNILTFADLIAPIAPEAFFAESWERTPLHIRRTDARYYETLLTSADVETAMTSGGLRFPAIQLAKGGAFFPPEAFTRNLRSGDDVFAGVPDLDRLSAEYRAGATISLPALHRAWRPLGALASAVEGYFDHAVHTNVYITPGNTAGFAPHYDAHEVFVLQIAGNKHWQIHKPPLPLPHRSQPFHPGGYVLPPPLLEVDLAPGDLLYLPRGFVHTTTTSNSFSMHVTLGITVYTWIDVLGEWIQSAKSDPCLRRALPPGFASRSELEPALKGELAAIIAELQKTVDHGNLLEAFLNRARAGRSSRSGMASEFHADESASGSRPRPKTRGTHR